MFQFTIDPDADTDMYEQIMDMCVGCCVDITFGGEDGMARKQEGIIVGWDEEQTMERHVVFTPTEHGEPTGKPDLSIGLINIARVHAY
jgi:hypothetical protein